MRARIGSRPRAEVAFVQAMSELTAVVLAAGQGKRMKSALAKVLHPLAGRPLVYFPVRAAIEAGAGRVVTVVSPEHEASTAERLRADFGDRIDTAVQHPPRGTGDAARVALAKVKTERVLILCGDTPLVGADDIAAVLAALEGDLALMSCVLEDPSGYGRVLRDAKGRVLEVREDRDLDSDEQRAVREVNAGVYAARTAFLKDALARIRPANAQGEYYLTDAVALAAAEGGAHAVQGHPDGLIGVNDRRQLAQAEALLFERIADRHRIAGVTVRGDARIDDGVVIGQDSVIEAGASLRGTTRVGSGTTIDTGCVLVNAEVGDGALFKPYSVATDSRVGDGAQIGPFAHLRPGSDIEAEAHIGNFVETKKTRVRRGAKANHLSYLGDGDVGEGANVGAGTIFCNYDGFQKHRTVIGEGAFIGSDSQIVAPVRIGKGAYVATGTTVTMDVPDDALAIGRTKQENKEGYASRLKSRLAAAAKKAKKAKGA